MMTMHFTSSVISGAGRGKKLGVPTFNLNLASVPRELEEGVYACFVFLNNEEKTRNQKPETRNFRRFAATMHYGPRPTFGDSRSCEVHVIERSEIQPSLKLWLAGRDQKPDKLTVEVVQRLRDIEKFESAEALTKQMKEDIEKAREILKSE